MVAAFSITSIRVSNECPLCEAPLRLQRRKDGTGSFLGCTQFPRCKFIEDYDSNLACIERELRGARADYECMQEWVRQIAAHLEQHSSECIACAKQLQTIKRFL